MELQQLTLSVCRVAREAGAYIKKERASFSLDKVERKHAHDYVSYVDKGSEQMIVKALRDLLPEAGFITEEGTTKDEVRCQMSDGRCQISDVSRQPSDFTWVVDPLDGTTNFIHGFAPYAVSIALCKGREIVIGVVYEIVSDECFYAWKGGKAHIEMRNEFATPHSDQSEKGEMRNATPELAKAIALNTTATHDVGNPTEQALLRWLQEQGVDYQQLRNDYPLTSRLPFSTERKYMSTTIGDTIYIKGAPEVVMDMCDLTPDERETAQQQLLEWQQHAMRTLAIAQDKTLLAIVAISDPLRKEVPAAIRQCEQAGIDVKIVTGDTAQTAMEIARQTGVLNEQLENSGIITGAEFAALSDEEALKVVRELKVMSRARPTDKQRLVNLLQQQGEVVAVTGDGTNDAPALNRAHVGLSLGSGTSVAKEASDITLIDDSFRSIVQAVMWGRSLYKNLQRFIFFQLVVNVTALLLVLFGAFIGTEMPLTITQILWVNLIMDTFAAMAMASLPPSREVMQEKPRSREAFIITPSMMRGIGIIGGLFFVGTFALLYYFERVAGFDIDNTELTIFFCIFVLLQWWNLFNARSLGSNHSAFHNLKGSLGFLFVLVSVLVGQWLIVTYGGKMFRTVPLSLTQWLWIFFGTMPVLIIGELYRLIARRKIKC